MKEITNIEDLLRYDLSGAMTGIRFYNAVNAEMIFKKQNGDIAMSKYADERFDRRLKWKTMQQFDCTEEEAYALYQIVKGYFEDYLATGYCNQYEVVEQPAYA